MTESTPGRGTDPDQRHHVLDAGGTRIHAVEQGSGPLVLLVHGFPESWYSWRNQLPALARAGFRAVAIDVRGYGRSAKPPAVEDYRMVRHVADNVGVVEALGETTAVVVGHDWGAPIAWSSCLLRPDMFRALALLSVPYSPYGRVRPLEVLGQLGGDETFYMVYFQEPGRAEAEIEADVRGWVRGMYFTASGDAPAPADGRTMASVAPGGKLRDRFVHPEKLPPWLSEEDLDVYVEEFEHSGFSGPLNRYRNMDRDWADLAAFRHMPIPAPSLFIGGDRDGPTIWGAGAISQFPETLPGLRGSHVLPGAGHWIQQERAAEVNELLVGFLHSL
ncbi:MAG TPA: alpha/beta hydrolase [Acidimicrobiales bacterium]|nr:alpha/beta hydrolase [Acidimicrobiales bacterium]